MVKIRLRRMGAKKKPFYRIVVADSRCSRDGRFIEIIGYYDPTVEPPVIKLEKERAEYWLSNGARPSDTTRALLKIQGLMGGVTKKTTEPKKRAAKAKVEEEPKVEEAPVAEAVAEAAPIEVAPEEAPAEETKPTSRAKKAAVVEEAPAEEAKPKSRAKKAAVVEEAPAEEAKPKPRAKKAKAEEAAPVEEPAAEAETEEKAE